METQKYLAINLETKEEFLCEKVEIEGFNYYVSNYNQINNFDWVIDDNCRCAWMIQIQSSTNTNNYKKVICCFPKNLSIPKVVDEVEEMAKEKFKNYYGCELINESKTHQLILKGICVGLQEKEKYQFTEKDMIEFGKFCFTGTDNNSTIEEDFKEWQSQKPIKIYFK